MKQICALALSTLVLALSDPAQAQQQQKMPRVGYLAGFGDPINPGQPLEAFRQGLRELGYIEGKNIHVDYRYVEEKQEHVPRLVEELLQLKVDVLVIPHTGAIYAVKQASRTIPIVIVTNVDPVATGIVDSLVRPGVNITGVTRLTRELSGKRLELPLTIKNRLPSMHERSEEVEAGGIMSYSADNHESVSRAAFYVDKILKGDKPGDLPVEQPTKFEFVINLKTAKQIGLTIPQSVPYRADKVIR